MKKRGQNRQRETRGANYLDLDSAHERGLRVYMGWAVRHHLAMGSDQVSPCGDAGTVIRDDGARGSTRVLGAQPKADGGIDN